MPLWKENDYPKYHHCLEETVAIIMETILRWTTWRKIWTIPTPVWGFCVLFTSTVKNIINWIYYMIVFSMYIYVSRHGCRMAIFLQYYAIINLWALYIFKQV